MHTIPLCRYTRPSGGVTVSPVKPDVPYTTAVRLVADAGMMLQKGEVLTACVDTDSTNGWTEIPAPGYDRGWLAEDDGY